MSRLESWVLAFIPDRDQFLFSRDITSYLSFFVVRRRQTLQIWAAIVKLILYSCFVPCFSSTVWFIIVSVMLYASSLAPISCFTYSGLYAWKLLNPMVYFSFLNEDSMNHLALYKVLMRSAGIHHVAAWSRCTRM